MPVSRARVLLTLLVAGLLSAGAWQLLKRVRTDRDLAEARAALARYDFAAARRFVLRAAERRPNDPQVWLLATRIARRDGELDEARGYLARYEALAGVLTPEGQLEDRLIRVQAGDIERHVESLVTMADAGHPSTEEILEALAVGSSHVYHLDRTGFWLHHLLDRFPRNPIGRYLRAQLDDTLGRRETALQRCRELLADHPEQWQPRLLLAGLLFRAQQFAEAAAEYEQLRDRRPDQPLPWLGLARCRERLGDADEARRLMTELQQRFPDHPEALLEAGRFALKEDRPTDAERLLRRAVQLAPNDHEAHYQLALCWERLGRSDEARAALDRFREIEADLARLEALLQQIVKTPRDPVPRREAGLICLRNGELTEAFRWLQGAWEVAPEDPQTHEALAAYYRQRGDLTRMYYHRQQALARRGTAAASP